MSKIKLGNGFTPMTEGQQILKIENAEYKEEFGKLKLTMVNAKGQKHFENYTFLNALGETVDGAIGAFSGLARAAMNDSDIEDIDPTDLVGKYVSCVIAYREYEDKEGNKKRTTCKADGTWWESVADADKFDGNATVVKPKAIDLDDLLG